MRVLIVDDEPLARERIRQLLADEAAVEIAGESHDGRSAVDAIRRLKPDLVFLDVQMPEMDGFAVLAALNRERMPVVVFVTAFDQFAIKAFEVCALDYLLKPFDRERFAASLNRARDECARRATPGFDLDQRLRAVLEEWQAQAKAQAAHPNRLVIKSGGRIQFLRIDDIDYIEAQGNYVLLHAGSEQYLHRETMARIEAALDPVRFARIHRSTIVNLERVKEMQPLFRGDYTVTLRDGRKLTLGKAYRDKLKA